MPAGDRRDPYLSFNFKVEADNQVLGGFNEVTGLDIETETEKFMQGGVNTYEQQLPGPAKFPSRLVLKSGITDASKIWPWYQEVMQGRITRKTVTVSLLDSTGQTPKRTWVFREAVPVKWGGPQLRAVAGEVAMETLELVHKGLAPS
jgi:phage tail-like protein